MHFQTYRRAPPFGFYVKKIVNVKFFGNSKKKSQKWTTQELSNIARNKVMKNQPIQGIPGGLLYDNQSGGIVLIPPPCRIGLNPVFKANSGIFHYEKWQLDSKEQHGFNLYHDFFHTSGVLKNIVQCGELWRVRVILVLKVWKFWFINDQQGNRIPNFSMSEEKRID